jgi:hypothetical protein
MKHLEIFREIEAKISQMCDEALKEGGIVLFNAVQQLSAALNQIITYKKPEEKKEGE